MTPAQAGEASPQDSPPNASTSVEQPVENSASLPFQHSISPQIQYPPKALKIFQPFGSHPFPLPSTTSFTIFDDLQDVISRGIVTPEKAEESVRHFRTTASNSPFVIISPDTSLNYLRRQKPFLLLTILAMATINNMKLQKLLDQEIRDTLGRRVFMSGEKSLDLLQGVLVYLTW